MVDINKENLFLNIHLSEKENRLIRVKKKIKESLYYMYFVLLKNHQQILLTECISIILQYVQFLYFPFDSYVKFLYIKNYSLI